MEACEAGREDEVRQFCGLILVIGEKPAGLIVGTGVPG